jgi:hypothetical protein
MNDRQLEIVLSALGISVTIYFALLFLLLVCSP